MGELLLIMEWTGAGFSACIYDRMLTHLEFMVRSFSFSSPPSMSLGRYRYEVVVRNIRTAEQNRMRYMLVKGGCQTARRKPTSVC